MKRTFFPLLFLLLAAPSFAQVVRDDFNRPATTDIGGSARWRKVTGLSHPSASIQINTDSTVSPYSLLGPYERGAAYWDSALSGRFLVGMILRHKSGSHNIPTFHIHLMNDSNWLTGDGYALRFQENSGMDRFDIQRLTGSGADTPFVSLLANFNREFLEGDTLMFKFYEDGTKTAVRYGADGSRDSISVVDLFYNPPAWYAWIQGRVFPDRTRWDNFMLGPIPYRITASAGPGGAISPGGNVHVNPGADAAFTITPNPGHHISDVIVDGVPLGPVTGYTFPNVASDHTIAALFQAQSYTITASAGPNGTITPSGQVSVDHGQNRSFTISPDPGYQLDSLLVDGIPVDSTTGYTFVAVTADHTIAARFSVRMLTVTASAGPHGSISPSGPVPVAYGSDLSFTIVPATGYHVDSVAVDGVRTDSTGGYTLYAVTADHTIDAAFSINVYTITATAGPNGAIAPSGAVPAIHGATPAFSLLPDSGYSVETIFVDGIPVDSVSGYTFPAVESDHTIHATFTDGVIMTGTYPVIHKWNIVSVPLRVSDFARSSLYPKASGSAYAYSQGYVAHDTLSNGRAYWLSFPAADSVSMTGFSCGRDTISVAEGWNMIGSISTPVPVGNVISIPGGLVSSEFYLYEGAYLVSQTIEPGRGYWVKMGASGDLVLGAGPGASPSAALRIVPASDLPPSPPGTGAGGSRGAIPAAFSLGQNYPNPFNPSTSIEFALPADAYVTLRVYNILGAEVARILDGMETAGMKSVNFDAGGLPTGVYTYRIVAGEFTATRRMLILR